MNSLNILLFTLLFAYKLCHTRGEGVCGDWDAYRDEKCLYVFDGVGQQAYDSAQAICENNSATLVTIHTAEEQAFLTQLVFEKRKVVDDVWIGAHRVGDVFKWTTENVDVGPYTNWAKGMPTNLTNERCVQMLPKTSEVGKWDDENCTKRNLFVCQKLQKWTTDMIQQTLLNERKQLLEIAAELEALKKATPFPIGFTYAQLPKTKEPTALWPQYTWKETSADYAGVFFRVVGGTAAPFGQVQDETCPRLTTMEMTDATGYKDKSDPIAKGGFAKLKVGATGGPWYWQFDVSNVEVRPKNQAIRIWTRTA